MEQEQKVSTVAQLREYLNQLDRKYDNAPISMEGCDCYGDCAQAHISTDDKGTYLCLNRE